MDETAEKYIVLVVVIPDTEEAFETATGTNVVDWTMLARGASYDEAGALSKDIEEDYK